MEDAYSPNVVICLSECTFLGEGIEDVAGGDGYYERLRNRLMDQAFRLADTEDIRPSEAIARIPGIRLLDEIVSLNKPIDRVRSAMDYERGRGASNVLQLIQQRMPNECNQVGSIIGV